MKFMQYQLHDHNAARAGCLYRVVGIRCCHGSAGSASCGNRKSGSFGMPRRTLGQGLSRDARMVSIAAGISSEVLSEIALRSDEELAVPRPIEKRPPLQGL